MILFEVQCCFFQHSKPRVCNKLNFDGKLPAIVFQFAASYWTWQNWSQRLNSVSVSIFNKICIDVTVSFFIVCMYLYSGVCWIYSQSLGGLLEWEKNYDNNHHFIISVYLSQMMLYIFVKCQITITNTVFLWWKVNVLYLFRTEKNYQPLKNLLYILEQFYLLSLLS